MSLIYPAIPGLTLTQTRAPVWNTKVDEALTGKQSALQLMAFPRTRFTHNYEVLRDVGIYGQTVSENRELVGFFNAMAGRAVGFFYQDPEFYQITNQNFAIGDGVTQTFPVTATYESVGGAGAPELIQNFNGTPVFKLTNWEGTRTLVTGGGITNNIPNSGTFIGNWSFNGTGSFAATAVLSPDGTADATSFVVSGAGNGFGLTPNIPAVNGQTWAFGIWMKCASGTQNIQVYINDNSGNLVDVGVTVTTTWQLYTVTANTRVGTSSIIGAIGATFTGALTFAVFGPSMVLGSSIPHTVKTSATITGDNYVLGPSTGLGLDAGYIEMPYWTPWPNDILSWSGSWYYLCRFDEDTYDFSKMQDRLWELKKISFTSFKI